MVHSHLEDSPLSLLSMKGTALKYQKSIHWPQPPLLCAGITVYSPMMDHKMNQPGKSLGVIGLGGLGHMAVKFGKAFGLNVTVFGTSMSKKDEALTVLGADNFAVSYDQDQMTYLVITHSTSTSHY